MRKIWKTFRFVWKNGWGKRPLRFLLLATVTMAVGGLMVWGTWLTKAAVDILTQDSPTWRLLLPVVLMLFGKELLQRCSYSGIIPVLESKVRLDAVKTLGERMYRKIGRLSVTVREKEEIQERIDRAERFLNREFSMFQFECTFIFRLLTTCVGVALSLAHWSLWFPVITVCMTLPVIFIRLRNNENLYRIQQRQQRRKRRNEYLYSLFLDRSALGELNASGAEFHIMASVESTAEELTRERYVRGQKDGLIQGGSEGILSFLSFGICMLLVMAKGHGMTVGAFAFLMEAVFLLQEEMINLGFNLKYFHESALYGVDLVDLDAMEEEEPGHEMPPGTDEEVERDAVLEVKNLVFSYPGTNRKPVLKNISFTLRKGETLALAGTNGSGKSTIVALLLGLYPPDSGEIRLNGIQMESLGGERIREEVMAVFQTFLRYETTVKDNIVLGNIANSDNRELIERAARMSTAETFFDRLEDGIDTKVGSVCEGAVNLSGGQWQRLAVTRGFFADPPLFLLDEPNAAVDPVTEVELFRHYREGMSGRSGVIISHRLAALQQVDRILVLDAGEIVEEGSHEELMEKKGRYYEMYLNQKNWAV